MSKIGAGILAIVITGVVFFGVLVFIPEIAFAKGFRRYLVVLSLLTIYGLSYKLLLRKER